MTLATIATCRLLSRRLSHGPSASASFTAWDEESEEAAQHVQRYSCWARGHGSAAKGMQKAAQSLKEAAEAMKMIKDGISEVQTSFKDLEPSFAKAEDLFGKGPEKDLQNAELAQLAVRLESAAAKSMEMTSELPGSTAWVELPDPKATAAQLEECAQALELGHQQLSHLQAAWVATQHRMEALEAAEEAPSRKRSRVEGPEGRSKARCKNSLSEGWLQTRAGIKRLTQKSKTDAAVETMNDCFHAFDQLVAQLARLFEELTCLESDVSSFHPQLLATAEIQAEVMGWKLILLEATEIPQSFWEFLESVLGVGDQLRTSMCTLQKRRQALVEDLKAAIEIQSAKDLAGDILSGQQVP